MIKKNDNILIAKLLVTMIMLIVALTLIHVNASTLQIKYSALQSSYKKEQKRFNERTEEPVYNFKQDLAIMAAIAGVYEQEFMDVSERVAQKIDGMKNYEVSIKWTEYLDGSEDELYDDFYKVFERLGMRMDFSSSSMKRIRYTYGGYSSGTFGVAYAVGDNTPGITMGDIEIINSRLFAYYYNFNYVQRPDYNKFNTIQDTINFPQIPMAIKVYPLIQPIKRKEF